MARTDPAATICSRSPEDLAAEWIARLRAEDCSSDDWNRLREWRNEHDSHEQAFSRHMQRWEDLDEFADEPDIIKMRLEAMALEPEPSRRPAWLMPLAASLVLAIATGLLVLSSWNGEFTASQPNRIAAGPIISDIPLANDSEGDDAQHGLAEERFAHSYSSAIGQRSKIDLPDGSILELNTDTVVEVNFTPQRREFRLVRGEALFDVAPDASRPFIVNSADERVVALGTVFSVRKVDEDLVVSLFEGEVQVQRLADSRPGAKPLKSARLDAGQQLISHTLRGFQISPVDGEKALGWRDGRLVFDDDRLSDVVAELNRYSVRKLALDNPELGTLRVSGTFRTGSAETFAAALSVALPVSVRSGRADGKIILEPAS